MLKEVKGRLGTRVEIVSVGAEWSKADAGVEGIVKNLGLLPTMDQVAELYRQSDLGVAFMTTPHPSYQPFEYMASGCVNASNINESTNWILSDENSLRLTAIPSVAAGEIVELVDDPGRWRRLRDAGLETIEDYSWENAIDTVISRLNA